MGLYTYLFCDLVTNNVLAELPLKRVVIEQKLNAIGTLQGQIPIADPAVAKQQALTASQPGRTALYVDRQGTLIWGGIIWTRKYSAGPALGGGPFVLQLGGTEFISYFHRRRLSANKTYTNSDQFAIVQDLVNYAQGVPGGNIGVNVGSNTSGVLRSQTWEATQLKNIGEAITELSGMDMGFDYAIDVAYVSGVPTKTLNLSYPRRGNPAQTTGWVFEYPGNVVDYMWPEDSSKQAITAYAQGAGSGASMLRSSTTNTALINGGYPLLEEAYSYKDITMQATLDAHAVADMKALSSPVSLPQLLVKPTLDPVLGSYTIGDDIRIRISDSRWPAPGIDTYMRIIGIKVQPQDDGMPERVILTLGAAAQ